MFSFALRLARQFAQALVANDSPRQVAWGFVLGMLIGLVPKGNLTVILFGVMLLGLRVNKPAGLMGIGVFTFLGLFLDSFAHNLGSAVLASDLLRTTHTELYQTAISPLLGLNNTVVLGQLLIGLYLIYPVYVVSTHFAVKVQAPLRAWLLRYKAVRWISGTAMTSQFEGSQWGMES